MTAKCKVSLFAAFAVLLLVGTLIFFFSSALLPRQAKSTQGWRLPVGRVTPMVRVRGDHVVILASDGSLWSCGDNSDGWPVLGLGSTTNEKALHRIGSEQDWIGISSSGHHTLALKADGTVWGWGENAYGQIDGMAGRANGANAMRPVPVQSVAGSDWKQVAAGGGHSLALKQDGTLWGWGNNWAGQLGIGSFSREETEPVQIGTGTNWVKVWAGLLESIGLQSDGSLWYWGDNPNPSVPQTGPTSTNLCIPARISAETNWVDIGFGPWTVLAIKADGTLWAFGREAFVFTGVTNPASCAVPVQVGTNDGWQAISADGWRYQILLKKDGSLWSLRADNDRSPRPSLTPINLGKQQVAAFGGFGAQWPVGVVVMNNGEVRTWGRVFGESTAPNPVLQAIARLSRKLGHRVDWGESTPVVRKEVWQLKRGDSN